jgi:hypothetical protein
LIHLIRIAVGATVALTLWASTGPVLAQAAAPGAAPPLDPARLMQGFPPPPEYRIHIGNWQRWPQKIWSFQNTREMFPTRALAPVGPVRACPSALIDLDGLQVGTAEAPHDLAADAAATHTDAVLVLHQGRIVEERYLNGMKPETPHLMFSATKSMVGLMGAVLVAEGKLDANARVAALLPELADSAWADATVRQVLDMTDGVRFTEIYTDPKSDIFAYVGAMGWAPDSSSPATRPASSACWHAEDRARRAARQRLPLPLAGHRRGRLAGVARGTAVAHAVAAGAAVEPARHGARRQRDARPAGHRGRLRRHERQPARPGRIGQMLLQRGRVGEQQIMPGQRRRRPDPRRRAPRPSRPRASPTARAGPTATSGGSTRSAALVRGDGRLRAAPVRLPRPPDGGGDVRQPPAADRGDDRSRAPERASRR